MAVTMNARWDNNGTVIPGGDAEYVVAEQPIAEYDNWFNYNIVADIQAVIDDVINKFNANTILKADTDNTPAALVVGANTIVGRAAGTISALSDSDVRTILNVEDGASADQTGAQIKTLYEAEADAYTDTKNTKLSGIDTGADVTGSNTPQNHASRHEIGGADEYFRRYELSNDVFFNNAPLDVHTNGIYTLAKAITLDRTPSTIRIRFTIYVGISGTTYGKIYRNGSPVGAERSTSSGEPGVSFTEDISGWSDSDELQLYTYNTGQAVSKDLKILGLIKDIDELTTPTSNDP